MSDGSKAAPGGWNRILISVGRNCPDAYRVEKILSAVSN